MTRDIDYLLGNKDQFCESVGVAGMQMGENGDGRRFTSGSCLLQRIACPATAGGKRLAERLLGDALALAGCTILKVPGLSGR